MWQDFEDVSSQRGISIINSIEHIDVLFTNCTFISEIIRMIPNDYI